MQDKKQPVEQPGQPKQNVPEEQLPASLTGEQEQPSAAEEEAAAEQKRKEALTERD